MYIKEYELPDGRIIAFEVDDYGVGCLTLDAFDALMEILNAKERK